MSSKADKDATETTAAQVAERVEREAKQFYPAYRYHASKLPRVVADADEDKALGKGWSDTPATFIKE